MAVGDASVRWRRRFRQYAKWIMNKAPHVTQTAPGSGVFVNNGTLVLVPAMTPEEAQLIGELTTFLGTLGYTISFGFAGGTLIAPPT